MSYSTGKYHQVPTSSVPFVETQHGRLRREQRGIDKKDLQRAMKYGVGTPWHWIHNGDPTIRYTYKDIIYTVNAYTHEEVTVYAHPLTLDPVPISEKMQKDQILACMKIQEDMDSWTSNTVLVIDTSGSMSNSDIWGTRNRLGAVWVSVALDFLTQRLENGEACSTDVISIVTLGDSCEIIVEEEPHTWMLYNKVVHIYNRSTVRPKGHGPFLPSLEAAEQLLTRNSNASCAMGLIFLTDGVPSDHATGNGYTKEEWSTLIVDKVGHLAKQFGRRLNFMAIGIGDYEDFHVLQRMVDEALDYGAVAELRKPSMTSSSLGAVFSTMATSITSTQAEMTDLHTKKQRKVRSVQRESRSQASKIITVVSDDDFYIYPIRDVKRTVYEEWFEPLGKRHVKKTAFKSAEPQHPDAKYVAMSKGPFGEGAERFAYRFFEVAADRMTIVGKAMVAKESRLLLEEDISDENARRTFVRTFCSTQQLAARLAEEFNQRLGETRRVDPKSPRVRFLDCSIYQVYDINLGNLSVLVEEKLDHNKWFKWNTNNGYVEGMASSPQFTHDALRNAMKDLTILIEEGSEDEEESDEEDLYTENVAAKQTLKPIIFTPGEIAQAFSHFTHRSSGRKRLVCDLQGVYDEVKSVLLLSDPVIHYYNHNREERHFVHGRTDKGRKGMAMFFETHKDHCGHLCKLVNRGFQKSRRSRLSAAVGLSSKVHSIITSIISTIEILVWINLMRSAVTTLMGMQQTTVKN